MFIFIVKLMPYINLQFPGPVGPNADAAWHAVRANNFVLSSFEIDRRFHDLEKSVNDVGLYPGGFHIFTAFSAMFLGKDIAKIIFILTDLLCSLGLFGYYVLMKRWKFSDSVIIPALLIIGLGSNHLYWLYFGEYPAIVSVSLLPAAVVVFEELLENKNLSLKIILGLLLMGYASLHSYFFLYLLLIAFVAPAIIKQLLNGKFRNLAISLSIVYLTSIPLTRNIISDFNFNKQTMSLEDSQKNPLSGRFWGNPLNLSLPNLYVTENMGNFSIWVAEKSKYLLSLLCLIALFSVRQVFLPLVLISLLLFLSRYKLLESPYNRLSLFAAYLYVPVLIDFLSKEGRYYIANILKTMVLSVYFSLIFVFSIQVFSQFQNESSLYKHDYLLFNYARHNYNTKNYKVLFIRRPGMSNSTVLWLKEYFLSNVSSFREALNPNDIVNENVVIAPEQGFASPLFSKSAQIDDYGIYIKTGWTL